MNLQIIIQTPTKKKKSIFHTVNRMSGPKNFTRQIIKGQWRRAKKYRNITRQIPLELMYMN